MSRVRRRASFSSPTVFVVSFTALSVCTVIPVRAVIAAHAVLPVFGAPAVFAGGLGVEGDEAETVVVTPQVFHLGNDSKPAWKDLTSVEPHGKDLTLEFEAAVNDEELTLEILAEELSEDWRVVLNGKEIGKISPAKKNEDPARRLSVPPKALRDGSNRLRIRPEKKSSGDDVRVGPIAILPFAPKELETPGGLRVRVVDAASGEPLPCRLTIAPDRGAATRLVDLGLKSGAGLAVRDGIIYTLDGTVELKLEPGVYRIWATRGFEYGLGSSVVRISPDHEVERVITLEREVDTQGWLAADTHIHTLTHSGHGDATVEERVVTLAGEGVEVAIATDHDHHTDYSPTVDEVGAGGHFASIPGNEFTTSIGHFNGFPADPDAKPPKHDTKDWVELLRRLRATPDVRVVVCNHPRRGGFEKGPFGHLGLDPTTGAIPTPDEWLGIDAVEVLNGKSLEKAPLDNLRDWLVLLDRGHRVAAVAGSDSHTVAQPVGQTRTYVRSSVDDPTRMQVDEVVDSFLKGRASVSLGLFVEARVEGRHEPGDLASGLAESFALEVRVQGPRWTRADRLLVLLNGRVVVEERITHDADAVEKLVRTVAVPRPPNDAHLVVVATGPAITGLHWPVEEKDRYVLGATNPVWIDADGDGRYSSPRETAERLIAVTGLDPAALATAIAGADDAVAVQLASLVRDRMEDSLQKVYEKLRDGTNARFSELLPESARAGRPRLEEYLRSAPRIEARSVRDD